MKLKLKVASVTDMADLQSLPPGCGPMPMLNTELIQDSVYV